MKQCSLFAPPPPSRADALAAEAEALHRQADVIYYDTEKLFDLRVAAEAKLREAEAARGSEET